MNKVMSGESKRCVFIVRKVEITEINRLTEKCNATCTQNLSKLVVFIQPWYVFSSATDKT